MEQAARLDVLKMDGLLCIQIMRPDGKPIDVDGWVELIESDSELERIEFADGVNPRTGEQFRIPYEEPAAVWSTHPEGYTKHPFVFPVRRWAH